MNYQFSTINRYILKRFYRWFLIMIAGFAAVITLVEALEFFRRLLDRPEVPISTIVEVLLLKLPFQINALIPLITLIATVMTFWKLNHSSELTVIRASGISIWKMAFGLAFQVILFGVFYIGVINPIESTLTSRLYFLEDKLFNTQHSQVSLQDTGLWLKERIDGTTQIFHAKQVDLEKGDFNDISVYSFDKKGTFNTRYIAREAKLQNGLWQLSHVVIHKPMEDPSSEKSMEMETLMTLDKIRDSNSKPETLSWIQNMDMIDNLSSSGLSALPYKLHLYNLFAKVGLMTVMVFFAVCFCLRPPRLGQMGILIGLCIFTGLIFHFMTNFISALGLGGQVPPFVAAWIPVFIGLCLSLALLLHVDEARA